LQELINQRSLTVINVGNNGDVTNFLYHSGFPWCWIYEAG